jgi:putative addiction module component (TIGR02574 family)
MSIEDWIALAQAIWDSIVREDRLTRLSESQQRELERRLADHEANPTDVVPWEVVRAGALVRWQR